MYSNHALERLEVIDAEVVEAARDIKVLSRLSWPAEVREAFLADWHRGRPSLPQVTYSPASHEDVRTRLRACAEELASIGGPLATYLQRTAESYAMVCRLLDAAGTHRMGVYSRALYGAPDAPLSGGALSNVEAARYFLEVSEQYYRGRQLTDADFCYTAEWLAEALGARLEEVFPPGLVRVEVDDQLASKAAAGATRIRLRSGTCFNEFDLEQLLQHEAFVHSLTAINGRNQPRLRSFGLGAPRTTGAQEGLATFSELVTGAIDIGRMERIALRVVAIEKALAGADFIDVFRFFLDSGQVEYESFNSAMRVFRGAPVTGGTAFTKDVVYLHGLMEVHTFFRWAMQHQRLELLSYFFAGRMTIVDARELEPLFADGTLAEAAYLPPWMLRCDGLAAYLAFSVFANRIDLDALGEHHRFDSVADLFAGPAD